MPRRRRWISLRGQSAGAALVSLEDIDLENSDLPAEPNGAEENCDRGDHLVILEIVKVF